jgi:ferric-dicitrate binding protein FerR (iron transport regulator)
MYLVNETDDGQTREVENWIQSSETNKKHFEQLQLIWEQSLQLSTPAKIDVEDAWSRMQQRIAEDKRRGIVIRPKLFSRSWLGVAASILIIVTTGWLGYVLFSNNKAEQIAPLTIASANKVVVDTLPDGSVITVNKNSQLSYPSKFNGDTREVALNGEAFFSITPNKKKPFIIHVNDITVRVVGTSFNIKSINGKTEVIVETGIVQVIRNKQTVQLLAKEKIVARPEDSILVKDSVQNVLYNYYRSNEFICNNTPLQSLVQTLNEAYGTNIIIENKALSSLPITTVFKEQSLDNILKVISETFKIKIDKTADTIILH